MGLERADKRRQEGREKKKMMMRRRCLFGTIDCRIIHQASAGNRTRGGRMG